MKIYDRTDNIFDAVNAVVENGVAVVEGSKTIAEHFAEDIIERLKPYDGVAPFVGFQRVPINGYLYYVYDSNRFAGRGNQLKALVESVDKNNA